MLENIPTAIFITLGGVILAYAANFCLKQMERAAPGWKKTPNFYSLLIGSGMLLLLAVAIQAVLLDPLSMTKVQLSGYSGIDEALHACQSTGGTPGLYLRCSQSTYLPAYKPTAYTIGQAGDCLWLKPNASSTANGP